LRAETAIEIAQIANVGVNAYQATISAKDSVQAFLEGRITDGFLNAGGALLSGAGVATSFKGSAPGSAGNLLRKSGNVINDIFGGGSWPRGGRRLVTAGADIDNGRLLSEIGVKKGGDNVFAIVGEGSNSGDIPGGASAGSALTAEQISILDSNIDSLAQQIINAKRKEAFFEDSQSILAKHTDMGFVVEALGEPLVRERAKRLGMTYIRKAVIYYTDIQGKIVGGAGPELDFLLLKDSKIVEIVSVKLNPKRIKTSEDVKLFNHFQNIPTNNAVNLRSYLRENFGDSPSYNRIVNAQVSLNEGTMTMSLDQFRQDYIGSSLDTSNVIGLSTKSNSRNVYGLQFNVTRKELLDIVASKVKPKLQ